MALPATIRMLFDKSNRLSEYTNIVTHNHISAAIRLLARVGGNASIINDLESIQVHIQQRDLETKSTGTNFTARLEDRGEDFGRGIQI